MKKRRRKAPWIIGALAVLLVTQCIGVWIPGLDITAYLVVGWIPFLRRVIPEITIRWDLIISTLVYLAALTIGLHYFLRWLSREWQRTASSSAAMAERPWRWRSTAGWIILILTLFTAGIATVGISHQTVWLISSPEPLYRRNLGRPHRAYCASNLRQINAALQQYAGTHDGRFPDDLTALILATDLTPAELICPASEDERATGTTVEEVAAKVMEPGHCSYVYLGKGKKTSAAVGALVVEPLNHHSNGINVLYSNGDVRMLGNEEGEALLISLGFEKVPVTPATTQP